MTRTGPESYYIGSTVVRTGETTVTNAHNKRLTEQPWAYNTLECKYSLSITLCVCVFFSSFFLSLLSLIYSFSRCLSHSFFFRLWLLFVQDLSDSSVRLHPVVPQYSVCARHSSVDCQPKAVAIPSLQWECLHCQCDFCHNPLHLKNTHHHKDRILSWSLHAQPLN